ncbi:hypothetical protein pb186bvf_004985 [Paramecium bursaria]
MNFLTFFKRLDLFKKPVQLMIAKQQGHATYFGAFLTILLIILIVYLFVSDLLELINKTNHDQYYDSPKMFTLKPENFTIQIAIQDLNSINYIDDSIYIIVAKLASMTYDQNNQSVWEFSDIPLISCSYETVKQLELQEPLSKVGKDSRCIDWDSVDELILQGTYDSNIFKHILINFYVCNNETRLPDGPECQPLDIIQQKLMHNFLSLQLSTVLLNLQDPIMPIKQSFEDYYTTVSNQMFKIITHYMQPVDVITDNGVIYNNYDHQEALKFYQTNEMMDLSTNEMFAQVVIRLNKIGSVTQRDYPKLYTIFAQIGGLWNFLFYCAFLLQLPISNLSFKLKFINSLFNFEGQDANKSDTFIEQRSPKRLEVYGSQQTLRNETPQNKLNQIMMQSQRLFNIQDIRQRVKAEQDIQNTIKSFFDTMVKKIKPTLFEYFTFFYYSEDKAKKSQFNESVQKIEKQLDIIYLIKKMQELDKLKSILLTPQQLKLFNYLPRPTIRKDPFKDKYFNRSYSILKPQKSQFQKAQEAQQAFQLLIRNIDDPINKSLIGQMDDKILEFLKSKFVDSLSESQSDNNLDLVEQVVSIDPESLGNESQTQRIK